MAGYTFTSGGGASALLAVLVMSLSFILLVMGLAFAIAGAQERIIQFARSHTRTVKRWGGVVLLTVGAWLVLLALLADFFTTIFPV